MRLLKFFRKNKIVQLPEMYSDIINKNEYNFILNEAKKFFINQKNKINEIKEGEIIIQNENEEEIHFYLDNLIRILGNHEKQEWGKIINNHFVNTIKYDKSALNFLYKDFEYAKSCLRVLIKSEDVDFFNEINEFIYRVDIPQTYTILVLEFEEKLYYIQKPNITGWDASIEELFEIAISNTPIDEIEVKELTYEDKFTVFLYSSSNYSASLMLDIENRIHYTLGQYGALIAIPANGSAFVYPIESIEVVDIVKHLSEEVIQIYNQSSGEITTNYYWYYDRHFETFPVEEHENGFSVSLPNHLMSFLNSK